MTKKLFLYALLAVAIVAAAISISMFNKSGNETESGKRKVYAVLPLTGAMSELGKTEKNTIDMYMANNPDSPIELVYVDSGSNVSNALSSLSKETVGDNNPIVISSPTYISKAVIPKVAQQNGFTFAIATIPLVDKSVTSCRQYQRVSVGVEDVMDPIIKYLRDNQIPTMSILYNNEEFGILCKDYVESRYLKSGGKIPFVDSFSLSDTNVRELVLQAISSQPAAILVTGSPTVGYANIFRELKSQGYNGHILADIAFANPFIYRNLGDAAENVKFVAASSMIMNSQNNHFNHLCTLNDIVPCSVPCQAYDAIALIDYMLKNNIPISQDNIANIDFSKEGTQTLLLLPNGKCNYDCILVSIINGVISNQ